MNNYKLIISLILILSSAGFVLTSCSNDEPKDKTKEIRIEVSAETGITYSWGDYTGEYPIECMLVKLPSDPDLWQPMTFGTIEGFTYERGHEYYLSVRQTTLANPPADASCHTYSLIKVLSDKLVAAPEVPVAETINSESDIKYQDGCPINKYSIPDIYCIDEDGTITYDDGITMPSYENARIWLTNILNVSDPNWVKYQSVPYQASYSYVISPLNDKIRLISNQSNGPMFKNVIPDEEYNHIVRDLTVGNELKYTLFLANVYRKGIQKLEFMVKKI